MGDGSTEGQALTVATGSAMMSATGWGWDRAMACEASISLVFALSRLAAARCASGWMALSAVARTLGAWC